MGILSDRVQFLSFGKRKAFFKRIKAAEQQEEAPGVREWLPELHQSIRRTSSDDLESFQYAGKIGEGEYGEVHLMRDKSGKEYALKMMKATEQECQYIISEALLWSRVESCTVARLYDAFSIGPLCFFLLELGGITLDLWMQKKLRKASPDTILSHMLVLLCSLDALHNGAGIIHGDLKPDNVVRCERCLLKLVDFGCAAQVDPQGQQQVGPEGSMAFMAPEKMFEGRDGTAADIYSMGGILYQLVFGYDTFPYCPPERFTTSYDSHDEAVADWQDALASSDFLVPPSATLPQAHMPAVLALLRGMLAKDPCQRWTLEQCVASPAFSDELLAQLQRTAPELTQHVDHFMDIRAASLARHSLGSLLDASSSCDDGSSIASRTPSVSSLSSASSSCTAPSTTSSKAHHGHPSHHSHHSHRGPSISSINIRPAYHARRPSTNSLPDLEAASNKAHLGPASPTHAPAASCCSREAGARGCTGPGPGDNLRARDVAGPAQDQQPITPRRRALMAQLFGFCQRPQVQEGQVAQEAPAKGKLSQACKQLWRRLQPQCRRAGDAASGERKLASSSMPASFLSKGGQDVDAGDFKISARLAAP